MVQPGKARASIGRDFNGLKIVIPSKAPAFAVIFLPLWLCGWASGEVFAVRALLSNSFKSPSAFLMIWLILWTAAGMWAFYLLIWMVKGKEIIVVNGTYLTVKRDFLGWGRTLEYYLRQVNNLRAVPPAFNPLDWSRSMNYWWMGAGTIAFDYGASTKRFGLSVEESEAAAIVKEIKSAYPGIH